jgi:uncharacterized membrane protein
MKFLMALGGFLAFATVGVAGFAVRRDPGRVVMEAAIAAVIAALLCRWLYGLFARSVNAVVEEKRIARINEATSEAMKKSAPAGPKL